LSERDLSLQDPRHRSTNDLRDAPLRLHSGILIKYFPRQRESGKITTLTLLLPMAAAKQYLLIMSRFFGALMEVRQRWEIELACCEQITLAATLWVAI
jgi:hypothetical protein